MRAVCGSRWGAIALAGLTTVACGAAPTVAPPDLVVVLGRGVTMDFVRVKPGAFRMDSFDSSGRRLPLTQVTVANEFYMARYEVTQEQWQTLMGTNPSHFKGPRNPVESVSWDDCQSFLVKLSSRVSGQTFVLPSEAQWEYACRAGTTTTWCCGSDDTQVDDYAWFGDNAHGTTHPVGEKRPNAWGFFDMHGNVMELCADASVENGGPPPDPSEHDAKLSMEHASTNHVFRGGAFFYAAGLVGSGWRGAYGPVAHLSAGFRPATYAEIRTASRELQAGSGVVKPNAVAPQPPLATAAAEARAMEILETYRGASSSSSGDPRRAELVALGHPAMNALVKVLCDDAFRDQWAMRYAAKQALPALAVDADVPVLVRRMREGHCDLEMAFAALDSTEAIAAHANLIRAGCFSSALDDAVGNHLGDPAIVAACCAWLAEPKFDGDFQFAIGAMAQAVGGLRPDNRPTMSDAGPALEPLLARATRVDARRLVATALVRLGRKAGVPALIEILATPVDPTRGPPGDYQRDAAGSELNAVSGTRIYVSRNLPPPPGDSPSWNGNFDEAAKAYAAWWQKSKDTLRFDAATRRWTND